MLRALTVVHLITLLDCLITFKHTKCVSYQHHPCFTYKATMQYKSTQNSVEEKLTSAAFLPYFHPHHFSCLSTLLMTENNGSPGVPYFHPHLFSCLAPLLINIIDLLVEIIMLLVTLHEFAVNSNQ